MTASGRSGTYALSFIAFQSLNASIFFSPANAKEREDI